MRARNKLYTPKECLKYWDECKPIRSGKLIWLSIRKCIERVVEQDEMLEKSHIVLDEFVGKFAGSKVFIDNGNHNKDIRNKTIDECINTIDAEYYDCGYGDYHDVEMVVRLLEQMKGGNNED